MREDSARYEKQQEDKTISLNEEARLKENAESEAREKARDKERLARHSPPEKVYELTLKQVDLPGLPPPVGSTNTVPGVAAVAGAAGTTPVAAAGKAPTAAEKMADDAEEKPPTVDATLEETEHILLDYISQFPKGNVVSAGPLAPAERR